ncbi:MAG: ATP-binding protein [Chitinophagaceae bacterium]
MNPLAMSIDPSLAASDSHMVPAPGKNNEYTLWVEPEVVKRPATQSITVLAHEVRNPLTNINLSLALIRAAKNDNDRKIYLDIIARSSERITNLVNELLTCQETTEVKIQVLEYSIPELLDEVLEMTKDRIALKNIKVAKEYAAQNCKTVLDRPKMKIALTNIVVNAIDAMASTKGKLTLGAKTIDGKYVVQIEDNGCGISQENLKHIFKPFFTNKPSGLGLGLSTTYDILWSNHVSVVVKSIEKKGTSFTLTFEASHT